MVTNPFSSHSQDVYEHGHARFMLSHSTHRDTPSTSHLLPIVLERDYTYRLFPTGLLNRREAGSEENGCVIRRMITTLVEYFR